MTDPHALDMDAVGIWLRTNVLDADGEVSAEKFAGGQSNPTYAITIDGEIRFVLRKKPPGVLLPSAHAVEREYRVTNALKDTEVPVARPFALCEDPAVVGTPFFIMRYVAGRNFWNALLPDMTAAERAAVYGEMNRVLATLHQVDPVAVDLADYGRPGNYFARQVARWTKQYRATETRTIDAMEELIVWLEANNPGRTVSRIVHGDYRNDNIIFARDEAKILAIIDWELSTLGDPLADLAQHTLAWRLPAEGYRGLADADLHQLGIPEEADYVRQYWARGKTAPPPQSEWAYALAFASFRNASIRQGVYKRSLDGNASSAAAAIHGIRAGEIAKLGWRIARGEHDAMLRHADCTSTSAAQ
jgi:aminoglycoside phosphotransferase (APT) family kinase protein